MIHLGIDIGSTTTKVCAIDARTCEVLFRGYARHKAHQAKSAAAMLAEAAKAIGDEPCRIAVSGSGGAAAARAMNAPYVQEVVASSVFVRKRHPHARTVIELGGQDAKMVFLRQASEGDVEVSDMRMNGSCAGGTGAFLDEMAALLGIPSEKLDAAASRGTRVYEVSGRCGVFAKTDIQPLMNQGVSRDDLALSIFHAVAKQAIGGLSQGADMNPPFLFAGGPLTFNPTLVRVFCENLGIGRDQAIIPDHPETCVAEGAALALDSLFPDAPVAVGAGGIAALAEKLAAAHDDAPAAAAQAPFFANEDERARFFRRHRLAPAPAFERGAHIRAYVGIDAGSTTAKGALVDEDGKLIASFYGSNHGDPLAAAAHGLADMGRKAREAGVTLDIAGCATTGYGELLCAKAFHADCHTVETVAHAKAASAFVPDATFLLDIGGQDMKAIWLDKGVITDVVMNEACSSGCGSFLETLASSLGIRSDEIADAAFASRNPASLGSRCTVFMNSSVVSAQREGKSPGDIVAGLCRSIVENVFTKVVRLPNLDALGDRIVVQGGTFLNDAVLRAFEQYVGREVVRAPYPGLMGAIGAALYARDFMARAARAQDAPAASSFLGFDAMEDFTCTRRDVAPCTRCENRCVRTAVEFSDGTIWVTGNRCPRGERLDEGDMRDDAAARAASPAPDGAARPCPPAASRDFGVESQDYSVAPAVACSHDGRSDKPAPAALSKAAGPKRAANLFRVRERLLVREYPCTPVCGERDVTIGIPRVLSFWETMPFWTTFFRALGFRVRISDASSRALYESGLSSVASDTVCLPAKLVHGHVRNLAEAGVSRIFMPIITVVAPEGDRPTSRSMCAVVKGYPYVVRSSDNPGGTWGVPFDAPLFHWYSDADRANQLAAHMESEYGVARADTLAAIGQADAAQAEFSRLLKDEGAKAFDAALKDGGCAVVLASRPYHNDRFVNHGIADVIAARGVPVLTPDSVPGIERMDLSASRLDIVNNYHARMLSSALVAARMPHLEYIQLVSFGCGHDAYLSDEIVRLMGQTSGKRPLILKIDESDASQSIDIRIRSFFETIQARREACDEARPRLLADPYPVKYLKRDRRERVILIPNTSHAFCRLMAAVFRRQGVRAEPLDVGREQAIRLGKKYVHNDICFPAQMTIGEALAALESGRYDEAEVAIGTGKYIGDCRLTHYAPLLRKALDDAGWGHVPIVTNDGEDSHDLHPGFRLSAASSACIAFALPMIDALEAILRRMRPYERASGTADAAFERAIDAFMEGIEQAGVRGAASGFKRAIAIMGEVEYDRSHPRPRVLIVGEYLLNFHPGANRDIERYLERNGMEVVEARMTDVIRKTYFYKHAQAKEYRVGLPAQEKAWNATADKLFDIAHGLCDRIAAAHPLYEPPCRMPELVRESDPIIHHTFDAGEGVLIPAEILHHAAAGCRSFLILQPFGCLPNHIVGRGILKSLKSRYPDAQMVALDYDPDMSMANIENRLQMLVMAAREAS